MLTNQLIGPQICILRSANVIYNIKIISNGIYPTKITVQVHLQASLSVLQSFQAVEHAAGHQVHVPPQATIYVNT